MPRLRSAWPPYAWPVSLLPHGADLAQCGGSLRLNQPDRERGDREAAHARCSDSAPVRAVVNDFVLACYGCVKPCHSPFVRRYASDRPPRGSNAQKTRATMTNLDRRQGSGQRPDFVRSEFCESKTERFFGAARSGFRPVHKIATGPACAGGPVKLFCNRCRSRRAARLPWSPGSYRLRGPHVATDYIDQVSSDAGGVKGESLGIAVPRHNSSFRSSFPLESALPYA